jgi:dimethylargininase
MLGVVIVPRLVLMFSSVRRLPIPRRIAASAVSAFIVTAIAHLATSLAFFISYDFEPGRFGLINLYFAPSSFVAFVLLAVFAYLGFFSRRYLALGAGLVAGVVGAVLGTLFTIAQTGRAITLDWIGRVLGTLNGTNLFFVFALAAVATLLGGYALRRVAELRFGARSRRIALVRLPASNLDEGELTHIERRAINADLADEQWDAYVAALAENGWLTVEVQPAPELADSVFVEDTVVMFGRTAVLTSPGAESRRGEVEAVERTVRELGLRIERIALPGTLDGGDVLKVGTTVYVGRGGRTNAEGIRQLRALVAPLGYTVVAVPVTKVLHLKSAVTALPDGTVIGYPPLVDDPSIFERFLAVPEEGGAHVVELAPDTVLMAASAPQSAELIRELGYTVVTVDISEFEKLEGCVTCLSVRVR